jgi:sulfoxide reductase catalytic subunit YedY
MLIKNPPSWQIPEREATPESVFLNRRSLLKAMGLGTGIAAGMGGLSMASAQAAQPGEPFLPKPDTNPAYADAGRPVTPEDLNTTYNNFYEFGSHKQIAPKTEALVTDGWTVKIDGLVEKEFEIGIDDLIAQMPIEERVYRHRCVEAWSMVAPWVGFPLAALVAKAAPLGSAKYVRFETFQNPDIAPGQRQFWYPWPYVEGLTMAEATNDLSLMVVGAYGKVLHKPFGAPLRLHTPWKYGFKHIKSIVRISFTEEQPLSFWEELQAREYGFWANVNPDVSHPRWTQAEERVLGQDGKIPTLLYNGYGEQVASLYTGMEAELGDRLYR